MKSPTSDSSARRGETLLRKARFGDAAEQYERAKVLVKKEDWHTPGTQQLRAHIYEERAKHCWRLAYTEEMHRILMALRLSYLADSLTHTDPQTAYRLGLVDGVLMKTRTITAEAAAKDLQP